MHDIWTTLARWWKAVPVGVLFACLALASAAFAADPLRGRVLTLGVHPYLSHAELQRRFAPLAGYLSQALGTPVRVQVGRSYAEHILETGRDHVDIAYLGPIPYVRVVEQYGPKPLLARLEIDGRPVLTGHIVAASGSNLRSLADLRGKAFAFGDPESTMSSIVPRAELAAAGVRLADLGSYVHLHGHNNVALAVLSGQADAGAVKNEVLDAYAGRGLRSLSALPEVSEHLFVARADLPEDAVERLRQLFLHLRESPGGPLILQAINSKATGFVPVTDADYDNLRDLLETIKVPDGAPAAAQ